MANNNLNKIIISKFLNFSDSSEKTTIMEELLRIKNGFYSEKVLAARIHYSSDNLKYKQLKKSLPSVTFSGDFDSKRIATNIINYSGFLILDIDQLLEPSSIEETKKNLFSEEFVVAVWVSPSGKGVKALVKIDTSLEYHRVAFDSLANIFNEKYKLLVDISGSDITRLCFSSYDENLLLKENYIGFSEFEIIQNNKQLPVVQAFPSLKIDLASVNKSNKNLLTASQGRNQKSDRDTMQAILKYLKFKKLSITSSYEAWYRIALAIANSFTYELGIKYYLELCRLDLENHDEEASTNLLYYCYLHRRINVINFATIVHYAQEKGFKLEYTPPPKKSSKKN